METLTLDELQSLQDSKEEFALINVLPEDSFQEAHIPGSDNVPVQDGEFVEKVKAKVGDPKKKIVVYCAGPDCDAAPTAAKKLEQAGFEQVYDFRGGIREWKQARLPYESGPLI